MKKSGERYPAPGNRPRDSGTLFNVGNHGYSWSSSVVATGSNAYFLNFGTSGIMPQSSNSGRAYGFPVRCLLE